MVGEPAYEGARVLAVRAAQAVDPPPAAGTPLLDQLLSERRLATLGHGHRNDVGVTSL